MQGRTCRCSSDQARARDLETLPVIDSPVAEGRAVFGKERVEEGFHVTPDLSNSFIGVRGIAHRIIIAHPNKTPEELLGGEAVEPGRVVPIAQAAEDRLGPCLEARFSGVQIGRPGLVEKHRPGFSLVGEPPGPAGSRLVWWWRSPLLLGRSRPEPRPQGEGEPFLFGSAGQGPGQYPLPPPVGGGV